jgi:hypothetical protein
MGIVIIIITGRVGRTGQIVPIVPIVPITRSIFPYSLSRRGQFGRLGQHRGRCGGQDNLMSGGYVLGQRRLYL